MEVFLFKPVENERIHNCSWYSVDSIPLEARRSPWLGGSFLALAALYTLCYLPCAAVMRHHLEHSCYKIMFALACCDIVALVNCSLISYFAIHGMVFCTAPTLTFLNCEISYGLWLTETTLAVLLAFDRCIELLASDLAGKLFNGWRAWCWVALVPPYALTAIFFTVGCSFSSLFFAYTFNPHAGYYAEWYNDTQYHADFQRFHNTTVFAAILTLYFVLLVGLEYKGWRKGPAMAPVVKINQASTTNGTSVTTTTTKMTASSSQGWQRRVFIQAVLISGANAAVAALFISFNHFAVPPWMIKLTTFLYLSIHGLPGILYLTCNATIRNECKQMFTKVMGNVSTTAGHSTAPVAPFHPPTV